MPDHRPRLSLREALLLRPPAWPSSRPPVPSMCCAGCLRTAACWAWRCARFLHLAITDSPPPGAEESASEGLSGAEELASEGLSEAGRFYERWPARAPDALLLPADFLEAWGAASAASDWCREAAAAADAACPGPGLGRDVARHLEETADEMRSMARLFVSAYSRGEWDRSGALRVADDACHRLTELALGDWRQGRL